ncbi:N-acetylmuramoyl-L-alanine amidase-like domain-containing protein [Eudoraea chungangensis]|uniref:N-acetylmuramoyl-L-alanine amidase-like domain-containing protein n=1 Tax=Eudoraea chungangensis TaxID=1481905 RepID=UPI0023EE155B|nr:N-acetylmuramoyl-L-alanine amidase-like domain-containing protein [Eudoraea chungangensis]
MKGFLLCFFFLSASVIFSQEVVCTIQDKELFKKKITDFQTINADSFGEFVKFVGLSFLETPYVAKTLEVGQKETLVVNFHGLDCTTYVENVLALSLMNYTGKSDFETFTKVLESVRYRDGVLDGYASRLHYFSDWIANNEKKGFVKDITKDIGGEKSLKSIDFMSTHRDLYPFLTDDLNFQKIEAIEKVLSQKAIWIIRAENIKENEEKIKDGDIIALTTSIDGLDITHTGLAIFIEDKRLHLLHASSSGKVTITESPLTEYLKTVKNNTGIMVARPSSEAINKFFTSPDNN